MQMPKKQQVVWLYMKKNIISDKSKNWKLKTIVR